MKHALVPSLFLALLSPTPASHGAQTSAAIPPLGPGGVLAAQGGCEPTWHPLGTGLGGFESFSFVRSLALFDDGSGPALFVGGVVLSAGDVEFASLVRWNGASWSEPGSGISDDSVLALQVFDDGSGEALYAGGAFNTAGGMSAHLAARWDGSSWTAVDEGLESSASLSDLAVFDDGSGPALHAADSTSFAVTGMVHRWNGSSWELVGSALNNSVSCLAVFDDGSGEGDELYVAGNFTMAGGVFARRIARWNGSSWRPLAGGGLDGPVTALAVFDDGSGAGPALIAAGNFSTAGVTPADNIARWDGSSWSALSSGTDLGIQALATFDDGSGPALFAGGEFTDAGGVAANHIARWDGSSWSALSSGVDGSVAVLAGLDGGCVAGEALYAGGFFTTSPAGDDYLARWGCDTTAPTIACPPAVFAVDSLSGPPGEAVTFPVAACDDLDPAPVIQCDPAPGSFFPRGTTLVTCTAMDASGNQSVCEFPVIVQTKARRR